MKLSLNKIALFAGISVFAMACEKKPVDPKPPVTVSNEVHFNFENYFGDEEIEMNSGTYMTSQGEEINITTFNYWITNIRLMKSDGSEYKEPESYRLLRGNKHATLHFHVPDVPEGTYTGVKFIIGVDVPRNTSGAQDGALDPAENGDMFWSWSTGYIQAKLEGKSPASPSADSSFQYHIGGVEKDKETPREVALSFANGIDVGALAGSVKIKADAAKWFGPGNPLKISETPTSTHGGSPVSLKIADNYAQMFSVMSAGNE